MDRNTQIEIGNMINAIQDQALQYFGNDSSGDPFERHVDRGDETLIHSRLVGEGVRLGLSEDLAPMVVSVKVDEDGYWFKIERH